LLAEVLILIVGNRPQAVDKLLSSRTYEDEAAEVLEAVKSK
jgi:hypothetical protein